MKLNKLLKKLIAFAMAAVLIAGGMTGFTTAKAAEVTDEEAVVSEIESGVMRAVANINFNVTSRTNYGKFTASKNPIYVRFGRCTTGSAHIKIHSGSYSGSVVGSFIMQYGNIPTQTVPIYVTVGSTYYITVEPYNDYIQAIGNFEIDY